MKKDERVKIKQVEYMVTMKRWMQQSEDELNDKLVKLRKEREVFELLWVDMGQRVYEVEVNNRRDLLYIVERVSSTRIKDIERRRKSFKSFSYPSLSGTLLASDRSEEFPGVIRTISCEEIRSIKSVGLNELPMYVGWAYKSEDFWGLVQGGGCRTLRSHRDG